MPRRAISPIIATLLLVAIAVAAAIIVYVFVVGLAGPLTASSGSQVSTQLQLEAYTFTPVGSSGTGTGQIVDFFLKNSGSSTISISGVYFDGVQLTEWGTSGTPLSYNTNLVVPTTTGATADGCFAAVATTATLTVATSGSTLSTSGSATACTGVSGSGSCAAGAFCVLPSTVTEVGLSTSTPAGLAAQSALQIVVGLNGASCGTPPMCPATAGTSHVLKIVTTSGGQYVFDVIAGKNG